MEQRRFAKTLRQNMTDAERLLWKHLRAHRFSGQKFRRQQPIGPYIVDFVHFGARLIVECDGGQHNASATDPQRDAWLEKQGFNLLRFWNDEILNQTESVLSTIFNVLNPLSPNPSPARGEGDSCAPNHRGNTNLTHSSPPSRDQSGPTHSSRPPRDQSGPTDAPFPLLERDGGEGRHSTGQTEQSRVNKP